MHTKEIEEAIFRAIDMVNAIQVKAFDVPPATLMGAGAAFRCGKELAERGITSVFLMTDDFLHKHHIDDTLLRGLNQAGVKYELWLCPAGEPNTDDVAVAIQHLKQCQCDGVLALGGGSVLDAAKVVALYGQHHELAWDKFEQQVRTMKRLPLIAVPTTAGTGSEATNVAVIINKAEQRKQLLVHSSLLPDLAIIDACLTLSLPPHITAATGVDALTHAIEAYVASNVTPLTKGLAHQAISLIGHYLPQAVGRGSDIQARESLMLASYMAGMAFSNAGLGLCHACAHQVGVAYNVPHGIANAIMLPTIMRFNNLVCKESFAEVGHAFTNRVLTPSETIDAVEQFIYDIGIITHLKDVGGTERDYSGFADAALQDECVKTNPRTVTHDQIVDLYRRA